MCYHDAKGLIMVRTQIQLTEEQSRRLKAAAGRRKVSVAELIRQGVEAVLERETAPSREELLRRAMDAAGSLRSSRHDVSRRHDDYLAESYSQVDDDRGSP